MGTYVFQWFWHFFDHKMTANMVQDRPKTAPRALKTTCFFMLNFVLDFGSFWAPFWSRLGSIWGPKLDPK